MATKLHKNNNILSCPILLGAGASIGPYWFPPPHPHPQRQQKSPPREQCKKTKQAFDDLCDFYEKSSMNH